MRRFLAGVLVGVAAVLAGGFLFVAEGGMPMAARNAKPLPLEELLAGRALDAAIREEAQRPSPIPADEANLLAGARIYRESCEACHGAPGSVRAALGAGMYPRPPLLLPPSKGVTDDPVGETFWKVRNGIRLTGMPSFDGTLSETAMWQVSLLVAKADQLPPRVADELGGRPARAAAAAPAR
jgi:mono/diheme cytochrome c family protein